MEEFTFKWPGQGFAIGDLQIAAPIVQGGMGIGVSRADGWQRQWPTAAASV